MKKREREDFNRRLLDDIKAKEKDIIYRCRYLSRELLRTAERLEKEGYKGNVNSLGVLQGSGPELDAWLRERRVLIDVAFRLKLIEREW